MTIEPPYQNSLAQAIKTAWFPNSETEKQVLETKEKMHLRLIHKITELFLSRHNPSKRNQRKQKEFTHLETIWLLNNNFDSEIDENFKALLETNNTPEGRENILFRIERIFTEIYRDLERANNKEKPDSEITNICKNAPNYANKLHQSLSKEETFENTIFVIPKKLSSSTDKSTDFEKKIAQTKKREEELTEQIKELEEKIKELKEKKKELFTENIENLIQKRKQRKKLTLKQKATLTIYQKENNKLTGELGEINQKINSLGIQKSNLYVTS